jgi:hypothetical protein
MSKRTYLVGIFSLAIALALTAGCVPLPNQAGVIGAGAPLPVATTAVVAPLSTLAAGVGSATAEVGTSLPPGTSGPLGSETPAPTKTEVVPGQDLRITLDDNGKTLTFQPGQRFLLYLGEGYTWDLNISDQNVIRRVPGVMVIRGAQGLFDAVQAGTTTITAVGDPACRQSQPPCAMPSRAFEVRIVVTPATA